MSEVGCAGERARSWLQDAGNDLHGSARYPLELVSALRSRREPWRTHRVAELTATRKAYHMRFLENAA
ncbi:MAG: hypothetical protein ACE5D3_04815 [Candidatus Binatia bacterium]